MSKRISTAKTEPRRRRSPRVGSREELVRRARALVPILRQRAPHTDDIRHLPDETRQELRAAGLARILQPARYGGCEAHLSGMVDILTTVGSGCGSTAWCLAQYIGHNFMVAQWPERAQETVWGTSPQNLLSGILIPLLGKARKVRGGYELSGQFPFVSGVTSCDWCLFAAMVENRPGGKPEERYFILPQGAFEILDTWDAIGLRGSASHDVKADRVFIPAHMTLPLRHLKGGEASPGRKVNRAPLYRSPSYMTFGILISSASVGIAEGIVRDYVEQVKSRVALMSGQGLHEQVLQHTKISEATMAVEAAKALLHRNCDEIMQIIEAGALPSPEQRTKYRAAGAYAGKLAFQAANLIWDAGGGRGVYMNNPIARAYRDICTATRHFTHMWDVNGATHGRVRVGLPLDNPAL